MKRRIPRVLYFCIGLFAAYLLFCWNAAKGYIRPLRQVPELPAGLSEVSSDSRFGPTPTWVTPGFKSHQLSSTVIVFAHGYGGSRGAWGEIMNRLHRSDGIDSLAIAMPGQEASPAKEVGFGISEGHAVVDAVKWARQQGAHRVVVLGISMGGAAAWMASGEDPTIDGIVTDAAYARFDEAMNAYFDRKIPGGSIILAPVVTFAKWMTHLEPSRVRPVDVAKNWRGKPALIIQGQSDTLVYPSQGERLAKAADCPIWRVPGAEHAKCYDEDSEGYLKRVVEFVHHVDPKFARGK